MSKLLHRIGRSTARHPWRTIGAWCVLAVVVGALAAAGGAELDDGFDLPGSDSERAAALLVAAGSARAGTTAQVVVAPGAPGGSFLDDGPARSDLERVRDRLAALPDAVAVGDPLAAPDGGSSTGSAAAGAVSPDGRVAVLEVRYPVLDELDRTDLEELRAALDDVRRDVDVQVEAGGELFFAFAEPEAGPGEAAGLAVAAVVLVVAFGSLVAAGTPIAVGLVGLGVGLGALSVVALVVDVPSWAPQIAAMVGLGVGIDYALFLLTRHRELLAAGLAPVEAAASAVSSAGRAVLFAGGTVVVSILGLAVAGIPFLTAAGLAVSLVVLVVVAASLTLLPAVLGLVGVRLDRLRVGRRRAPAADGARWARWGRHVARRPGPWALGVCALLLVLAAPVTSLDLGLPDEGTLPTSRTERRAYDLVAGGFGPGANGPLLVVVDPGAGATAVGSSLDPVVSALAGDEGVAAVGPPAVDPSTGIASIVVTPTTAPQDDATYATVERVRASLEPALAGTGAVAHVGGATATVGDVAARVTERLPVLILTVVAVSFLLLVVLFRSVLVPLKAAVANLLSIGSAYGVLVAVFQWGWGAGLLGVESTVPIVSFVPMFMFAMVFGLSMDYEVFLLSRVREELAVTGDTDEAVVRGLAGTARVITSAALIMVAVFGGFVLGSDPTTKMFGLGLATAIAVDATIVRCVLVPATMALLGDANWWLPRWLDRRLPHLELETAPSTLLPDPA